MKRTTIVLAGMLVLVSSVLNAQEAWERWERNDPSSTQRVDHSEWTTLLGRYLETDAEDGINRFDYAGVTPDDRERLQAYLQSLEAVQVSTLNSGEQLAYWINVYNAFTVEVILEHYPVDSIREINISGIFSRGPWGAELIEIEGESLTLDDVEHRILRPIWDDPRIHYAVNCASIGCPNLQPVAFTRENADDLMTQGAESYVNHPRGVAISGNRMTVSSIYNWFQEDFGGNEEGVVEHLLEYARPALAAEIRAFSGRIRYDYDWSINRTE
jgi:hypothetical protein